MDDDKEREQRIRERAYQIWLDEGQPEGRDIEHWQEAEKQTAAAEEKEQPEVKPPLPGPYEMTS